MNKEDILIRKHDMILNSFFIYEAEDEYKFPVIGFQNFDENAKPYMSDASYKLFAGDMLGLLVRSCPDRKFDIEWVSG